MSELEPERKSVIKIGDIPRWGHEISGPRRFYPAEIIEEIIGIERYRSDIPYFLRDTEVHGKIRSQVVLVVKICKRMKEVVLIIVNQKWIAKNPQHSGQCHG